jgi:apolipoprotein N-acyltransferase
VAGTVGNRVSGRNARAIALAVAGGVVHGLAFPPGAWPLAFVALAPLVAAVHGRSGAAGFALGWLAGSVAAGVCVTWWLVESARSFFGAGPLAALAIGVAATQVFGALPIALFGWMAARLSRLPHAGARVVAIAAAWVATELARTMLLTGNPWNLLGHALYTAPLFIQVADFGGVPAVSFVVAATSAALAEACVAPARRDRLVAALTGVLILAADAGYGACRLATVGDRGAHLRVALVQANLPTAWRNDPTRVDAGLRIHADLTRIALAERPDLIVWPENAVGVLVASNERIRATIADTIRGSGAALVFGAPRAEDRSDGRVAFFNAAQALSADGAALGIYDKRHLVPFAEYRPFGSPRPGDYTPGAASGVIATPAPIGILVCFEALYPGLTRALARDGATVLVNLSHDGWFPRAATREQHFAGAVFRAVEVRRPLVRVANAGVTASVDAAGRVRARFPLDIAGAFTVDVAPSDVPTPYARWGDAFGALAMAIAIGALARVTWLGDIPQA